MYTEHEFEPLTARQRLINQLAAAFDQMIQDKPTVETASGALRRLRTGIPDIDVEVAELAEMTFWMWNVYRPVMLA